LRYFLLVVAGSLYGSVILKIWQKNVLNCNGWNYEKLLGLR